MQRFAIVNTVTNVVTNIILYDGVSPYTPPAGNFLVDVTNVFVDANWVYDPNTSSFSSPQLTLDSLENEVE